MDTPVLVLEQALWRCKHTRESFHLSAELEKRKTCSCCLARRRITPKAEMPETAEAVSATLTTSRNCTIEITNVSSNYWLINPKVFMTSGYCYHPPQPTIQVTETEVCSFTKDNTLTGAAGLLTYDLFHIKDKVCSESMAVMFSVPYDLNLGKNLLAVGVVESTCACDKYLHDQMYEGEDFSKFARSEIARGGLEYKAACVDVRATMSTVGKAIVKVELFDKMGR